MYKRGTIKEILREAESVGYSERDKEMLKRLMKGWGPCESSEGGEDIYECFFSPGKVEFGR